MKMNSIKMWASLVALVALVFVVTALPSVSAFVASVDNVAVDGTGGYQFDGKTAAVTAGQTIPIKVIFTSSGDAEEVRVVARLIGEHTADAKTDVFDVFSGSQYSKSLTLKLPSDLDENLHENYKIEVTIEGRNSDGVFVVAAQRLVNLEIQRQSNLLEILSIQADDSVETSGVLAVDVVVKNRGTQEADDTFVTVSIPELGISKSGFIGDLSPVDQGGDVSEKDDTVQGRIFLNIPQNVREGLYVVEVDAHNADSSTIATTKVFVSGATGKSQVIASSQSKSFALGETVSYSLTLVNSGNSLRIYQLVIADADSGLNVNADESVVVVPAGSSKTVKFDVSSSNSGTHNFIVNVLADGQIVDTTSFTANVEGRAVAGSAAVLLTVVLAIIFVVLLVVLIVLLTRKPDRKEEFGESYY